jgi:endonuclease/exonuclease/phosphatase family metal-dependent hydrolase
MKDLLSACNQASEFLFQKESREPIAKRIAQEKELRDFARRIRDHLHSCFEVYSPPLTKSLPALARPFKAVAWNIERGKHLDSVLQVLKNHPQLKDADFYFLTEVDWGMARTDNRNVTAELGEALGLHAYFAPSYYNFTKGHGTERHLSGKNEYGLHGKAMLSRAPLENLHVVSMPNATDKLNSKEARLGEKRALVGDLNLDRARLRVVCAHLDAYSSPQARAIQLKHALRTSGDVDRVLIAGDWNTNTINSSNGLTLFRSVLGQLILTGPKKMVTQHYPAPERKFDRPLFEMLKDLGFDYEGCNEIGTGTFDLLTNDQELGQMARDQYPMWILKLINRLLEKSGGRVSLKIDWFAAKNLRPLEKKVLRLKPGEDYPPGDRPSDHHPILLSFNLES